MTSSGPGWHWLPRDSSCESILSAVQVSVVYAQCADLCLIRNIAYLAIGADAVRKHKQRKSGVELEQATACIEGRRSLDTVEGKPPSYAESEVTIFPVGDQKAVY